MGNLFARDLETSAGKEYGWQLLLCPLKRGGTKKLFHYKGLVVTPKCINTK